MPQAILADQHAATGSDAPPPLLRMNAFQRVMLQWSELHPYVACHAYQLAGTADAAWLRESIRETYRFNGLGAVEIAPDGLSYRYLPDPGAAEVEELDGGDPTAQLVAWLGGQLNRPFARPRCCPLRFAIVPAGPTSHYVAVAYDHWIADNTAARLILRHVLGRYLRLDVAENRAPLAPPPGTLRQVFARPLSAPRLAAHALRWFGGWLRGRRAAQPIAAAAADAPLDVAFTWHRTAAGTVARLREFAHRCHATVHDVLLAATARAVAPHLPQGGRRSPAQALSTVVDLRGQAEVDLGQSLGTFLGYYVIRCRAEKDVSLGALTAQIAAQTRPIKEQRRYFDSLVGTKLLGTMFARVLPARRREFLDGALPLTAGVTNVVLRDAWIARDAPGRILGYLRAAPTGPVVPLALAPSTCGEQLNLGATYRAAILSADTVGHVMSALLEQLEQPQ